MDTDTNASALSSTSNSSDACYWTPALEQFTRVSWTLFYHIVTPLHFLLGLPAHCVALITFRKQSRHEEGYSYQIYLAVIRILALLSFDTYVLIHIVLVKFDWFARYYWLVWFNTHLGPVLAMYFINANILLSISVSADRLFALRLPLRYRSIDHGRHRMVALGACLLISLATNIQRTVHTRVMAKDDGYRATPNPNIMNNPLYRLLNYSNDAIFIMGTVLIAVSNILMAYYYRQRNHRVHSLQMNRDKDAQRRQREKTLFTIIGIESAIMAASNTAVVSYYVAGYASVWFRNCGSVAFQATSDGIVEISDLLQFYVTLGLSKEFRLIIVDAVPVLKRVFSR